MKLYYAKTSDKICRHCGGTIKREEVYVIDQIPCYGAGGSKALFVLTHYDCYIPWKQKKLQQKFEAFTLSNKKPTRKGRRPDPCLDRLKRNKLESLRAYHRKEGHLDRVEEINAQLQALKPCVEVGEIKALGDIAPLPHG